MRQWFFTMSSTDTSGLPIGTVWLRSARIESQAATQRVSTESTAWGQSSGQRTEDGPDAVLLADVVGAGAEALLAADTVEVA